jgi:hypothetical protein
MVLAACKTVGMPILRWFRINAILFRFTLSLVIFCPQKTCAIISVWGFLANKLSREKIRSRNSGDRREKD